MSLSATLRKYKDLLANLLPKGLLWDLKEQPNFKALLDSFAQEFCRVDKRAQDLIVESDPRTTTEADLLTDWQRVLALPDECTPETQTLEEKQAQITQKYTNVGGLSKNFFEALILDLGFAITISNPRPFLAGSKAGDRLTNYFNRIFVAGSLAGTQLREVGWRFYFEADMPIAESAIFVAGSLAGEPLRFFENEIVQCTLQKNKPAHTALFSTFF